jgi:hypothetical protein
MQSDSLSCHCLGFLSGWFRCTKIAQNEAKIRWAPQWWNFPSCAAKWIRMYISLVQRSCLKQEQIPIHHCFDTGRRSVTSRRCRETRTRTRTRTIRRSDASWCIWILGGGTCSQMQLCEFCHTHVMWWTTVQFGKLEQLGFLRYLDAKRSLRALASCLRPPQIAVDWRLFKIILYSYFQLKYSACNVSSGFSLDQL